MDEKDEIARRAEQRKLRSLTPLLWMALVALLIGAGGVLVAYLL